MKEILFVLATWLWLGLCAVLLLAAEQEKALAQAACERINIIEHVFKPWLESLMPGSPDYETRLNDYSAAWERWIAIPKPPVPAPARWLEAELTLERVFDWASRRQRVADAEP